MKPKNIIKENLDKVIRLCRQMLDLADLGDRHREDAGCGVVFGALRDDAYKVLRMAEKEKEKHSKEIDKNKTNN